MDIEKQQSRAYVWKLFNTANGGTQKKVIKILKRKNMQYSIKKGIYKVIKYGVIFALPVALDAFIVQYPEYAQLTVGGILVGILNYLKVKFTK